jgi:hypothetical protein
MTQCCGSIKFWYGSGCGYIPWIWMRILLFSSVIFKTSTKNSLFAYSFLMVHLHNFPKIKRHKDVTKQYLGINVVSLQFSLEDRRIRIHFLTNGSGCGSGRPKNIWILRIRIRIRIRNTDMKVGWQGCYLFRWS